MTCLFQYVDQKGDQGKSMVEEEVATERQVPRVFQLVLQPTFLLNYEAPGDCCLELSEY